MNENLFISNNIKSSIILKYKKINDNYAKSFLKKIYSISLFNYGSNIFVNNNVNKYNIGLELINEIYNNIDKIDKDIINILYNNYYDDANDTNTFIQKIMINHINIYNLYLIVIDKYNNYNLSFDINKLNEIFTISYNNDGNINL